MIGGLTDGEYGKRTEEFTSAFGEFAFNFEGVCYSASQILEEIFWSKGLDKESKLVQIVTYDSTAYPLLNYIKGALNEYYAEELSSSKDSRNRLTLLIKKMSDAIELRNNLIHSFWGIGYYIDDDVDGGDIAIGLKNKITKNGHETRIHTFTSEQFREVARNLEVLCEALDKVKNRVKSKSSLFDINDDLFDGLDRIKFEVPKD